MAVRKRAQISMDDRHIEDPDLLDLLDLLERREDQRNQINELRKGFSKIDQEAKGSLAQLEQLAEGPVRCGRFILSRTEVPARPVSFESKAKTRFEIKLVKEAV